MKISERIEKVRQEPEHVRVRYVWGSVVASMVVVLLIWVVSLKANMAKIKIEVPASNGLSQEWDQLKGQSQSIRSLMETEPMSDDSIGQDSSGNLDYNLVPDENSAPLPTATPSQPAATSSPDLKTTPVK
ncbi:hypothetical protein EPO05_01225 [Patescibacteria group bacterium]|nr:MAG: hypothetical protein EPO05_01225 [Patescibacteria group bacterium]